MIGSGSTPTVCRAYRVRVAALAERARRARSSFLPPEEPPDRDRALEYLRDGVGPAVALHREASIGAAEDSLSPRERRRLDRAFDDWIELYAACYGVHLDIDTSVTEAATLLEDGLTLREATVQLTGVPARTGDSDGERSDDVLGSRVRSERG